MGRNVKICLLRAKHAAVSAIGDAACDQMVFSGPFSLLSFWSSSTNGFLTFNGSAMKPWVDITVAPGDGRTVFAAKAFSATRAATGETLAEFDAFIVLLHPGTIEVPTPPPLAPGQPPTSVVGLDGGAGAIEAAGGKPMACLPVMPSTHSFCAHEVGHVLGFEHTFGVLNNGIEYDPGPPYAVSAEYGDPYDIMSADSFGTHNANPAAAMWFGNPRFTVPVPAGWPAAGWGSVACGPARATVHFWEPTAVPQFFQRSMPFPTQGQVHRVRVSSTGAGGQDPQLIILHPDGHPDGEFRCYLEYRTSDGWDRGLAVSGPNLSRRGLVAHTLSQIPGTDRLAVWYRGTVPVPLGADTDLAPFFTPIVVRVVNVDPHELFIDVEVTSSAPREITVTSRATNDLLAVGDEHPVTTPCGDPVVVATRTWRSNIVCTASTRGYGGAGNPVVVGPVPSPVITWTVNGVEVPVPAPPPPFGPPAPEHFVDVPVPGGTLHLRYDVTADPSSLVLSDSDPTPRQLAVTATAREPSGDFPRIAQTTFSTRGTVTGLSEGDSSILARCLVSLGVGIAPGAAIPLRLPQLMRELAGLGAASEAAAVQQTVVDMLLRRTGPDAAASAVRELADGQHTLAARWKDLRQFDRCAAEAESAVLGYLRAATLPGSDVDPRGCVAELFQLSRVLSHHAVDADPGPAVAAAAAHAQQAGVDLWRGTRPPSPASGSELTDFADALHNLALRLADAARLTDAAAAGQEAVTGYRQAAAVPGADQERIVRELRQLATGLFSFGLQTSGLSAQDAAAQLGATT